MILKYCKHPFLVDNIFHMENKILVNRIQKIRNELKKQSPNAALLLASGQEITKSRDLYFDFKQDTNFYYFTNSHIKNTCLLIKANDDIPLVLSPHQSKEEILWIGKNESPKNLARTIGGKFVECDLQTQTIISHLKGVDTLCYSSNQHSISNKVTKKLLQENTSTLERYRFPYKFINQDFLIAPLRQIKEKDEIENIRKAVKITLNAIEEFKNFLRPGITELDAKNFLEYEFKKHDGQIAFDTICASGKNAATLHHTSSNKVLQKGEMILLDLGAEYNMYAADISRTLPVSGAYSTLQQELINGVKRAQNEAIKKAVAGNKYKDVQKAADLEIINLLKEFKILKGSTKEIIKNNSQREYFPHSIGHVLGLDTHDIGRLLGDDTLKKNMIITIEPGVYFRKKINNIIPLGIRIEDDILIGESNSQLIE